FGGCGAEAKNAGANPGEPKDRPSNKNPREKIHRRQTSSLRSHHCFEARADRAGRNDVWNRLQRRLIPRSDQRKEHRQCQDPLPKREAGPGVRPAPRNESCSRNEHCHLRAPRQEVVEEQGWGHDRFVPFIARRICFRSSAVSFSSSTRWTSSGSAAPVKTPSTNTRHSQPLHCISG